MSEVAEGGRGGIRGRGGERFARGDTQLASMNFQKRQVLCFGDRVGCHRGQSPRLHARGDWGGAGGDPRGREDARRGRSGREGQRGGKGAGGGGVGAPIAKSQGNHAPLPPQPPFLAFLARAWVHRSPLRQRVTTHAPHMHAVWGGRLRAARDRLPRSTACTRGRGWVGGAGGRWLVKERRGWQPRVLRGGRVCMGSGR